VVNNASTNETSYVKSCGLLCRKIGLPVDTGGHCFRRLHASLLQQAGASRACLLTPAGCFRRLHASLVQQAGASSIDDQQAGWPRGDRYDGGLHAYWTSS
jgi:hypothetical protein